MPRLRQQVATVPIFLVQQLTELHAKVEGARREALDYARQAGDVLLTVPAAERPVLWAAAGIKRRSGYVYVQIAENWEAVQRAASIREALKIIGHQRLPGRGIPLPFEDRCVITKHEETGWCEDDG